MKNWWGNFSNKDIFFISPDIKRAIGLELVLPRYHIICSYLDPLVDVLRRKGAKILCLEEESSQTSKIDSSGILLEQPRVLRYISEHSQDRPHIMFFKPSLKLEILINKHQYKSIGVRHVLNERYENKINFVHHFKEVIADFLLPYKIGILGKLDYQELVDKFKLPLVIQFGHGWAGKTTFFIKDFQTYRKLISQFPYTKVRITKYIEGMTILNNCCLYRHQIFISPPAVQLSGIKLLHVRSSVTCGRQWPAIILTEKQTLIIEKISQIIGKKLAETGYMGYFGLDFIVDKKNDQIFVTELNARLTASAAFYTYLELGLSVIPQLAYHLAGFCDVNLPINSKKTPSVIGSQLIIRKTPDRQQMFSPVDFGVFKCNDSSYHPVSTDYYPQNLKNREYIFIKRTTKKKIAFDDEIARIESKDQLLTNRNQLQSWVINVLQRLEYKRLRR